MNEDEVFIPWGGNLASGILVAPGGMALLMGVG